MLLHLMTWQEVEEYLKTSTGIMMPIGSTEQHGPTGLIGTDAICAEAIAKAAGEIAVAAVAPTIGVGMAQHHMAFTGSMTLRPSTLVSVIADYVNSLSRHGFERFYFINGHGGNISTVQTAFQEVYAQVSMAQGDVDTGGNRPRARCVLRNWYQRPRVHSLAKKLYGGKEGHHATPSEVAVTQYVYPDAIKSAELPELTSPGSFSFTDADDYRRRFPDGRMASDPSLARPEHGKELLELAAEDLASDYREFLKD